MEINSHDAVDLEDPHALFENSFAQDLENLPVLSSECSISKVPPRLRLVNEKAFTPKVVSIGPLHHGLEVLKAMEKHKQIYLKDFIRLTGLNLGICLKLVRDSENKLRACYAEVLELSSDEFVKIILTDAAFILGVLLENTFPDLIFSTNNIYDAPYMVPDVVDDILLLENQLPLFILNDLLEFWKEKLKNRWKPILELSYDLFERKLMLNKRDKVSTIDPSEVHHFVDFLRRLHLPLVDQVRGEITELKSPTMTALRNAGVKFEPGLSLQFKKGVLEIPRLEFHDVTEALLRNLVAFEQCFCDRNDIADYLVVIDCLVDTEKDVDLLAEYGILNNFLGDNKEVSSLINKLRDGVNSDTKKFLFASLCKDLDDYSKTSWHKWKANLKQNYMNSPWAIVSLVAGGTLLILTFIQTMFSGISAYSTNPNGQQH